MISPTDPSSHFGKLPADELRVLTEHSIATLLSVLVVSLNPHAASETSRKAVRSNLQSVAADLQKAAGKITS